ncbi:NCS2 family permease [Alkaliphilus sp. MSJ-5]|uniref:NCS2 family permease n=1 Tax=Alkaliphilus flagellatus TaxID=2841507 RepID=A0ABS6FY37_9FIRM|nr:NCS2 family permease [Alkaliphilus flagellatus]MBU5675145.1 NCS2 family permease [Alkaliphilus flagellatus]
MEIKKYPWFIKEDIDAFFALFQNNLANFVVIAITMISIGYPADIVYSKVIPGAAIGVLFGNFYYAHMASKLSVKENRLDVTALSYGISTPVMFIYLFGVMKPALDFTGDPQIAWKIGVAACFLGGVVESLGSLVGTWIKNNLPRASMLGALAGVAFSVIGGQMFFHTYEAPIIGIFVLAIILVGLVAKKQMPFKIPASLFAIIIGTVLAYAFREANIGQVTEGLANVGFYPPLPSLTFIEGLQYLFGPMIGLLAVLLPISIYNFIETMNNVEAMSAAGDSYNVAEAQLFDGVGTMIGALFGGVFPTTVYIASVSAKWTNAGRGYSIINGLVFLLASTFGIIAAMSKIIPLPVVAPILVFVGISMVSQAFSSVEEKHYPAVVLAMLPYLANYLQSKFASSAPEALEKVSSAIIPLGQGAMFTALIWGAILVFILDNEFKKASVVSFIGAILSAVGLIHAPKLSLFFDYKYALAYLIIGIAFIVLNITLKDSEDESQLQKNLMVD